MDRSLRRELKSTFGNSNYWFNTSNFKNAAEIKYVPEMTIEFLVPKEMVSTSSLDFCFMDYFTFYGLNHNCLNFLRSD